jgi:hypothetical protein
MANAPNQKELENFKELLMSNSIQVDAVAQLLIEKGIITKEEFHAKLGQVVHEYRERQKGKTG